MTNTLRTFSCGVYHAPLMQSHLHSTMPQHKAPTQTHHGCRVELLALLNAAVFGCAHSGSASRMEDVTAAASVSCSSTAAARK